MKIRITTTAAKGRSRKKVVPAAAFIQAAVKYENAKMTSMQKMEAIGKEIGITKHGVAMRVRAAVEQGLDFSKLLSDDRAVESVVCIRKKDAPLLIKYMAELRRAGR